jgi:phospholipase C
MLENRSFDHMLGYLKLEGGRDDVDGLTHDRSNTYNGNTYPVHHLSQTAFREDQDPCHDGDCVTEQLDNGNGGFVSNYAKHYPDDPDPGLVMGYYNGATLSVYDHLAREFCICDAWFSSVPGATWPNRLYAVTGQSDGSKDNETVPFYNLPSFVRHLDAKNVSWRWYSNHLGTLRLIDETYRNGYFDHFYNFDKGHRLLFDRENFLDHAASGDLAAVSWIDPAFVQDPFVSSANSNDDHPPSDVMAGQELVLKLYNAVIHSPAWEKTLLVITYDEHGGFYDHVAPPPAADDDPNFRRYGVRVPAFIISPWVERGMVWHTLFDHTSIIKTILLNFCQAPDGSIPDMGARVTNANHLGELLTQTSPRPPTPVSAYQHLIDQVAFWRSEVFKTRLLMMTRREAPKSPKLTEFQEGILEAQRELRRQGLPEGQP